jgi:hypothetical protein
LGEVKSDARGRVRQSYRLDHGRLVEDITPGAFRIDPTLECDVGSKGRWIFLQFRNDNEGSAAQNEMLSHCLLALIYKVKCNSD